ncbi:putative phage-associated protein [Bradyrhizobium diazoefficiens]
MSLKTYSALDIAKYALATAPEDGGISNLKLQKLCYYAQGLCTAMRGVPLFNERVVAWDHGPVVAALYHEYKPFGANPIPAPANFDKSKIDKADRAALDDIIEYFGQYSAWKLRNMTHEEAPWANAYKKASGSEIPLQSMVEFFRPQLDDEYVKNIYGEQVQRTKQG